MHINQRWFAFCILILCLVAIPVSLLSAGKSPPTEDSDESMSNGESLSDYIGYDHISVVRLNGMIVGDGDSSPFFSSADSAGAVLKQLRKAVKSPHVKGVLFRIDSPGGTVSTSQEIADEIKLLQEKKKPVVVSMGDVAASGGYYVACGADKIVADPGTITGSIGVIMSSMNLKGLGDKLGLQPQVIKSGQFKDIGSPYRPMTPEDKAILQGLINDAYDQFTNAIADGRKLPIDVVKKLADGRIYSGRQALKLNLIDKLGSYTVALDLLQDICKERYNRKEKLPVKEASRRAFISSLLESSLGNLNFSALKSQTQPASEFSALLPEFLRARYYHLPLWLMP